jgi:hypothetical protein
VTVDVPGVTPVTIPLVSPIVIFVLLVFHVPPAGISLSIVDALTHICNVPFIAGGNAPTVTIIVAEQPETSV